MAATKTFNMRTRPLDIQKPLQLLKAELLVFEDDEGGVYAVPQATDGKGAASEHAEPIKMTKKANKEYIPTPKIRHVTKPTLLPGQQPFKLPDHYVHFHLCTGSEVVTDSDRYDLLHEEMVWLEEYNGNKALNKGATLTDDQLEVLIDLFEKEAYRLAGPGKADCSKEFDEALAAKTVAAHPKWKQTGMKVPAPVAVRSVYDYWLAKRRKWNKSLMRKFQEPVSPTDTSPNNAFRPRAKEIRKSRRKNVYRDEPSTYIKLRGLKKDFERVVELMEHMRRRELMKRNLVLIDAEILDQTMQQSTFVTKLAQKAAILSAGGPAAENITLSAQEQKALPYIVNKLPKADLHAPEPTVPKAKLKLSKSIVVKRPGSLKTSDSGSGLGLSPSASGSSGAAGPAPQLTSQQLERNRARHKAREAEKLAARDREKQQLRHQKRAEARSIAGAGAVDHHGVPLTPQQQQLLQQQQQLGGYHHHHHRDPSDQQRLLADGMMGGGLSDDELTALAGMDGTDEMEQDFSTSEESESDSEEASAFFASLEARLKEDYKDPPSPRELYTSWYDPSACVPVGHIGRCRARVGRGSRVIIDRFLAKPAGQLQPQPQAPEQQLQLPQAVASAAPANAAVAGSSVPSGPAGSSSAVPCENYASSSAFGDPLSNFSLPAAHQSMSNYSYNNQKPPLAYSTSISSSPAFLFSDYPPPPDASSFGNFPISISLDAALLSTPLPPPPSSILQSSYAAAGTSSYLSSVASTSVPTTSAAFSSPSMSFAPPPLPSAPPLMSSDLSQHPSLQPPSQPMLVL